MRRRLVGLAAVHSLISIFFVDSAEASDRDGIFTVKCEFEKCGSIPRCSSGTIFYTIDLEKKRKFDVDLRRASDIDMITDTLIYLNYYRNERVGNAHVTNRETIDRVTGEYRQHYDSSILGFFNSEGKCAKVDTIPFSERKF